MIVARNLQDADKHITTLGFTLCNRKDFCKQQQSISLWFANYILRSKLRVLNLKTEGTG